MRPTTELFESTSKSSSHSADGSRCAFEDEVVLLHKGDFNLVAQLSCRECSRFAQVRGQCPTIILSLSRFLSAIFTAARFVRKLMRPGALSRLGVWAAAFPAPSYRELLRPIRCRYSVTPVLRISLDAPTTLLTRR